MKNRYAIVDTETTGLGPDDQIVELAVAGLNGGALINRRLRPAVAINPEAALIHGISMVSP